MSAQWAGGPRNRRLRKVRKLAIRRWWKSVQRATNPWWRAGQQSIETNGYIDGLSEMWNKAFAGTIACR